MNTKKLLGVFLALGLSTASQLVGVESAQAQALEELVVGRVADISVPDPNVIGVQQFGFHENVYDTLIRYVDAVEPQPALAESWEFNADKTQLTLNLRQGVVFHSGNPFTAADVVYTLERVKDPKLGAHQVRPMAGFVTDIEVAGDHNLTLTFDQARANFMDVLAFMYIADSKALASLDAGEAVSDPGMVSGTGPYALADWRPGQEFRLTRNPDYWADILGPDRITVRKIADSQSLMSQLRAGAVHIAEGMSPREVATFIGDSRHNLVRNEFGAEFQYLGMNTTMPPFDNQLVRQAMAFALDRDRFVNSTMQGIGIATAAPWAPSSPAFREETQMALGQDLDKARALLDEAGHETLDVTLLTSTAWPPLLEQAQQFQSDLAKIGVNLEIEVVDVGRWVQAVAIEHTQPIWTGGFAFSQYSPESLFAMAAPFRVENNMPQYSSPEFESLVSKALSEPDPTARDALLQDLTAYLQDQAFTNPIAQLVLVMIEGPEVKGAEWRVSGFMSYASVVSR